MNDFPMFICACLRSMCAPTILKAVGAKCAPILSILLLAALVADCGVPYRILYGSPSGTRARVEGWTVGTWFEFFEREVTEDSLTRFRFYYELRPDSDPERQDTSIRLDSAVLFGVDEPTGNETLIWRGGGLGTGWTIRVRFEHWDCGPFSPQPKKARWKVYGATRTGSNDRQFTLEFEDSRRRRSEAMFD